MAFKVSKGMRFNLDKNEKKKYRRIRARLLWPNGVGFDADLSVAALTTDKVLEDGTPKRRIFAEEAYLAFYGSDHKEFMDVTLDVDGQKVTSNKEVITTPRREIIYYGDNRTGGGEFGGEMADIDLDLMDPLVHEVAIVGTIYLGEERKRYWSTLNARLVLEDIDTGEEILTYELGTEFPEATAVQVASFCRLPDGTWDFTAIGKGYKAGLEAFIEMWT